MCIRDRLVHLVTLGGTLETGLTIGERTAARASSAQQVNDPVLRSLPPGGGVQLLVRDTLRDDAPIGADARRITGQTLHDLLSRVRTAADLDAALTTAVACGDLRPEDRDEWRPRLSALFDRSDLAPWFGPGLDVLTETPLILSDGRSARPDRLVRAAAGWGSRVARSVAATGLHAGGLGPLQKVLGYLSHSGPEIPPSLRTRQKWMAMKMMATKGSISTCSTYQRMRVSPEISLPPRSTKRTCSPMTGE